MIDLDTIKKEEQYKIPEGYFDQFPQQVMTQIRKDKAKRQSIWLSAVAAVLAAVICSISVVRYIQQDDNLHQEIVKTEFQEGQLEEQMVDYYSTELAQMDYLNY